MRVIALLLAYTHTHTHTRTQVLLLDPDCPTKPNCAINGTFQPPVLSNGVQFYAFRCLSTHACTLSLSLSLTLTHMHAYNSAFVYVSQCFNLTSNTSTHTTPNQIRQASMRYCANTWAGTHTHIHTHTHTHTRALALMCI